MSTALQADEPILKEVRRILVEQLDFIRKTLARQPLSDKSVHTVRKELKRVRASLRLLRDALGAGEYQQLNQAVRDAARPISAMRDAKVLQQALDKVLDEVGDASSLALAKALRRSLQQELCVNRTQLTTDDIAAIRVRLNAVSQSLLNLSDAELDKSSVEAAVRRAQKKARRAFEIAEDEVDDENLHEWRKQVKYELNQLVLLQPLKPKRIAAIIRKTQKLSDHLGDDHDLAILHDRIVAQAAHAKAAEDAASIDVLLETVASLRAKLQKKAFKWGRQLHAKKLRRRITKYLVR